MLVPRFAEIDAPRFAGCLYGSPIEGPDGRIVVASGDGEVAGFDPATGRRAWSVALPKVGTEQAVVYATPVRVDDLLVVAYQRVVAGVRVAHSVAVVDLVAHDLDPDMPPIDLSASGRTREGAVVEFLPPNQASRAALQHSGGLVYMSLGNIQDIQPWHGWVFEIDLGAWRAGGEAIRSALLTTAEVDCGTPGHTGAFERICGGGVWAPAGPQIFGDEILVPTGNGQLDIPRGDYANTMMRVRAGLAFDPGCDPALCEPFDIDAPAEECLRSCRDLFVPRLLPGDPPLRPESGQCDGLTFLECYARLDWDLGANAPAVFAGYYLLPGKDGALYLIDPAHLGNMLDREVVAEPCGTREDACTAGWAGMMVTQPVVAGDLALVPTFQHDQTHPAGVVAVAVEPGPRLSVRWRAPSGDEGLAQFRRHPGRIALVSVAGETYAFVVDVGGGPDGKGLLYGIRARDGTIASRTTLFGRGQRYVRPLVLGTELTLTSCDSDSGPGLVEGYRVVP